MVRFVNLLIFPACACAVLVDEVEEASLLQKKVNGGKKLEDDEPEPDCSCPRHYAPVCANGETYSNSCVAGCAGVFHVESGACPDPPACTCSRIYAPVCAGGRDFSNSCIAQCEGFNENQISEGACSTQPEPCICTSEYAPVCDANGNEYSNACAAGCAGVVETTPCPSHCGCGPMQYNDRVNNCFCPMVQCIPRLCTRDDAKFSECNSEPIVLDGTRFPDPEVEYKIQRLDGVIREDSDDDDAEDEEVGGNFLQEDPKPWCSDWIRSANRAQRCIRNVMRNRNLERSAAEARCLRRAIRKEWCIEEPVIADGSVVVTTTEPMIADGVRTTPMIATMTIPEPMVADNVGTTPMMADGVMTTTEPMIADGVPQPCPECLPCRCDEPVDCSHMECMCPPPWAGR